MAHRTKPPTMQAAKPDSHTQGFTRRGPRAIAASRAATTTVEGRRSGSFANIDRNRDPRGSAILHSSAVSHSGSEVRIAWEVSAAVSCRNGWWPLASSVRTTPSENTSLAPVRGFPWICSGDMYPRVPMGIPARSSPVPIWAAAPKSRTLTYPSGRTIRFSGLMSRCTTLPALAAAHAGSVVHRDIKPENLMVRPDGYVKVLDFGAAAQIGTGDDLAGIPIGTLGYMSPEQIQGKPLTGASDVFSLGVMLTELASGSHPFLQDTAALTSQAIRTSDPGWLTANECKIAEPLGSLLRSTLAKEP